MATIIRTKSGKKIVLRNPAETANRYARQMKKGYITETGEKLSKEDMAFRAGYLKARSDSAKAYKSNNKHRRR